MPHFLIHSLHRLIQRPRYAQLEELLRIQSLGFEAMQARQQRELSDLIDYVTEHSPYYAQHYAGLRLPSAGGKIEDLPILRKSHVMAHRDELVDRSIDRRLLKLGHTGGSTGKPLAYYYHDAKHVLMRAGMYRSYMWSGWRPGQKILNFWGARRDLKSGNQLGQSLKELIAAERTVGAYEISEERLSSWARLVQSYKPVLLQGYASVLAELARHVVENRLSMPATLIGVYSTAEVLYAPQRQLMEQAFHCKVYNQYGCREVPNIAVECPVGNQHVLSDMVHLESVEQEGEQRLLVTSLTNRVFPFIRYDLGDIGRLLEGQCPCGSSFPLMEVGQCRSNDLIRTPGGKRVYPSYFIHLLDGLNGVRQFQFVQTTRDEIRLDLVSDSQLDNPVAEGLKTRLRTELDPTLRLDIRYLKEISRTASGKHRFVIALTN